MNDERTRSFIALSVCRHGAQQQQAFRQLRRMIGAVNKAFVMHGLQVYYKVRRGGLIGPRALPRLALRNVQKADNLLPLPSPTISNCLPSQDPQPHVSVAWIAGDHEVALKEALQRLGGSGAEQVASAERDPASGVCGEPENGSHGCVGQAPPLPPLKLHVMSVVCRLGNRDRVVWEPGN